MTMYYNILETDEILNDLVFIAINAYDYTRDKQSGEKFLDLYNLTVANIAVFPDGFIGTSLYYRGYKIYLNPFGNYNLFFIIDESRDSVVMLRLLYQKQDWKTILHLENKYHNRGKEI